MTDPLTDPKYADARALYESLKQYPKEQLAEFHQMVHDEEFLATVQFKYTPVQLENTRKILDGLKKIGFF